MKAKLVAILVLAAAAVAVSVVRTAPTIQKNPVPHKDGLSSYVNEAKSKGQHRIVVPAPLVEQLAGTISAEEALSSSTVVVTHLISKESYRRGADEITTWNKFVKI